jgi:hypothetical protein
MSLFKENLELALEAVSQPKVFRWEDKIVKVMSGFDGPTAFVQDVKTGQTFNVPWSGLKKFTRRKKGQRKAKPPQKSESFASKLQKKLPEYGNCPECRTPSHISGIECPGCGIK